MNGRQMLRNAACFGCFRASGKAVWFVHLVASPDMGAWRKARSDGILGALRRHDARSGACCFMRRARGADLLVRRNAG